MTQLEIWKEHTRNMSVDTVLQEYHMPAVFQTELTALIGNENDSGRILEVGCETGVLSMMLKDTFEKVLLDYNEDAILLAKKSFCALGKNADFVVGDMFNMPFEDESFHIIFNAGVLEHFSENERSKAILEYCRVLKKGGVMYLAVPNHYSVPYRIAYIIRNLVGKWAYPKENKIYDFSREIEFISELRIEKRVVLSKSSVMRWLDFSVILKRFFKKWIN